MNLPAKKIAIIKQLADVESEEVLRKIAALLRPVPAAKDSKKRIKELALQQKVAGARADIKAGKGVNIPLEDLWK